MSVQIMGYTELSARLARVIDRLEANPKLMKNITYATMLQARTNARSKGGRTLWKEIAWSVHVTFCTPKQGEIVCNHVAARQRHFGGVIRAKNKDFLTIPINARAYGKTTSDFSKLFRIGKALFIRDAGENVPLFALCRETKPQRATPWWPSETEVMRISERELAAQGV